MGAKRASEKKEQAADKPFWAAVEGKPVADADDLYAACCDYFAWVQAHPLQQEELIKHQGAATKVMTAKPRAMSVGGLCLFLGLDLATWGRWRAADDARAAAVRRAECVIDTQKFEGACAGLFNASLVARDLGLSGLNGQGDRSTWPPLDEAAADSIELTIRYASGSEEAD